MKNFVLTTAFILALPMPAAVAQPGDHPAHKILAAEDVTWTAGPPSLAPGARSAVLYGDPSKEGQFVMRLWLPAGFKIAPHTHPRPEIVTVISGAFRIGMGTDAGSGQSTKLTAGGFFAFDPGLTHHAHAEEETVVQISSTGPWGISYVNPADDPRQNK